MVLPGFLDVYRTLPNKLLAACRIATALLNPFEYFIKADDDTFLNLPAIINAMPVSSKYDSAPWWGQFRREWPVAQTGKWAEFHYQGKRYAYAISCAILTQVNHHYNIFNRYPTFACGGAYALPLSLAQWLGTNADTLYSYQGEDVSLGIWLAALGPKLHDDARWQCFKTCEVRMLASPEHSPSEMRVLWKNQRECDNPCGCLKETSMRFI